MAKRRSFDKDKKDDKEASPSSATTSKTETPGPTTARPVAIIKGKVFKNAKDVPRTFNGKFVDCKFEMDKLEHRNFHGADFRRSTFKSGFTFVRCNLGNAKGVEKVAMKACLPPKALRDKAKERKPKKAVAKKEK